MRGSFLLRRLIEICPLHLFKTFIATGHRDSCTLWAIILEKRG